MQISREVAGFPHCATDFVSKIHVQRCDIYKKLSQLIRSVKKCEAWSYE